MNINYNCKSVACAFLASSKENNEIEVLLHITGFYWLNKQTLVISPGTLCYIYSTYVGDLRNGLRLILQRDSFRPVLRGWKVLYTNTSVSIRTCPMSEARRWEVSWFLSFKFRTGVCCSSRCEIVKPKWPRRLKGPLCSDTLPVT